MGVSNISLDQHKQRMFGDFLHLDGLTEIAVNPPESCLPKSAECGKNTPFRSRWHSVRHLPLRLPTIRGTILMIHRQCCPPRSNLANVARW